MDIQADLVDSNTGYDVTSYFWMAFIKVRTTVEMPPPTALGRILGERFKRAQQNFTHFLGTVSLTNLPDMTPLAASGRLKNATQLKAAQNCVKWVRPGRVK